MEGKLRKLLEAAVKIAYERSTEKLLVFLSNLARELLEADRCSIFLYDPKKDVLWTVFAHGVDRISIPPSKGVVGFVFQTGKGVIINDAYSDERFNPEVDKQTGYRTENILAVPMFDRKGNVLGVFQAINKRSGGFNSQDLELLTLVASYASSAIENKMLQEKLEKAYRETIYKLSAAAEYKDKETKNHIVRTGIFAKMIGQKLGLDEDSCQTLLFATPMHDIGKIGIPDSILLKPGKLSPSEWKIMQRHTLIGYEILKDSDSELLNVAAQIALEHHENWDGSGYPRGLKGQSISLFGRIAAVVDVFDALTSKRPYKEAWSIDRVVDYFEKEKGRKFQRELAQILLDNIDEFVQVKRQFPD